MGTSRIAVILLGHGSRLNEANQGLATVAARVAELVEADRVEVAYLQLAHPGLREAAARCVGAGATRIVVVPLFLFPGAHVRDDIPSEVAQLRLQNPGVTFTIAKVLGDHPKLAELAADRAREALA
jgi:sirohydrochlorin ferrochelatase